MADDIRGDDVFDSRTVDERIEDLRTSLDLDTIEDIDEEIADLDSEADAEAVKELEAQKAAILAEQDEDDVKELAQLEAFKSSCEGYCDWRHGTTFIAESYFETYAEELAEDIGAIQSDAAWPNNHIDWKAAAAELRIDYTEEDLDGTTYLFR